MQFSNLINVLRNNTLRAINLGYESFSRLPAADRFRKVQDAYEDFIGIKEVRRFQQNVLAAESEFSETTKKRRSIQSQLMEVQDQLKQVRQKLDQTHRGHESYLELITGEHNLIKKELNIVKDLNNQESVERDLFTKFSQTLRDAHEAERFRQEKSRYLSLIGSIIGALIGVIATSINHSNKMKDINKLVTIIERQNDKLQVPNVGFGMKIAGDAGGSSNVQPTAEEVPVNQASSSSLPPVSEDQIATLLSDTETHIVDQLEQKMKLNSLTTVVATYTLIAVTIPIILRVFSD